MSELDKKTIIYLRTSTEEQNPENQLADCQKINFYGPAEIIEDTQSAWKDNKERPGFELLKTKIINNKVLHLIVWDFDRLFRNRIKFKEFLEIIKAYHVKLHSFRQQWLESINKVPSPWNEIVYGMMIEILGWMAEEESKKKSERIRIAYVNHVGNKWGRPGISEKTKAEILNLWNEGMSMRMISEKVTYWDSSRNLRNISIGAVHKIIKKNSEEKSSLKAISSTDRFMNKKRRLE